MDLSIIVPVYNTPRESLLRCFDSMDITEAIDFEVIIVDDGSAREVGVFCQSYAAAHERFKYLFQENRGVSSARNTGLTYASGEYLMFVDADDELISGNLSRRHFDMDCDIVFFDLELREEKRVWEQKVFQNEQEGSLDKKKVVRVACKNRINSAWARMFRRSMLLENGIRFDESMVIAEDAQFVFLALLAAKEMSYADCAVYRYYHSHDNGERRLAKYPERALENLMCFYKRKIKALEECGAELLLSDGEVKEMVVSATAQIVEDIFNSIGTLLTMGIVKNGLDDAILELATEAWRKYGGYFSLKTKIKCLLLKYDLKAITKICADFRKLYIMVKALA